MRFLIALLLVCIQVAEAKETPSFNQIESNQKKSSSDYNCKAKNLSTNPLGPITYYEAQFGQDQTAFSIWRMPCQDGSFMPVMTIEPISHKPFVCSFNFSIEQNNQDYNDVLLLKNPKTKWSFLCGDVKNTKTVKIHQLERPYFDSDEAFTLVHKQSNHPAIETFVPALDAEQVYNLGGQLSGSYVQAGFEDEAFIIQVTESSEYAQASVYWMKYHDGYPVVLKGSAEVVIGQTDVDIELFDFFNLEDSDDIDDMFRGSINLFWQSCDEVVAVFETYPELQSTDLMFEKVSGDIEGLVCN